MGISKSERKRKRRKLLERIHLEEKQLALFKAAYESDLVTGAKQRKHKHSKRSVESKLIANPVKTVQGGLPSLGKKK